MTYTWAGRPAQCFVRLGLPAGVSGTVGLAALIVGGATDDVLCDEPTPTSVTPLEYDSQVSGTAFPFHSAAAAVLTSGSSETWTRDGDPMITMLFLGPGRGDGSDCGLPGVTLSSSGDPTVADTPSNTTGDDYYGEMSLAAFTAAVRAARDIVDEYYGGNVEPALIVVSHSDGITLASQYVARNGDAIVLIDVEGPTDALEKTVATECFDPFGTFVPMGACAVATLPGTLDYATWSACRSLDQQCGSSAFFERAWERFFRPPDEPPLLASIRAAYLGAPPFADADQVLHEPYDPLNAIEFDWGSVLDGTVVSFWEQISAINFLPRRRVPYVRAGCWRDHAQPDHYLGRHNTRALMAAARSGQASPADLFWLPDAEGDPVRFSTSGYDPDSAVGQLPLAANCEPGGSRSGSTIEVDLARWAFQAWLAGDFPYSGYYACMASCEGPPYDDPAMAAHRRPCVEACLRGRCGLDGTCYQGILPSAVGYIEAHYAQRFHEAADRCVGEFGCQPERRVECLDAAAAEFIDVNGAAGSIEVAFYRWLHPDEWDDAWRPGDCP
ncbi:MAG: hypothetical protein FJ102_19065 [Deltaproteobacteria bacterium]|nr:hypothetical protein [Deltaproteobacteria bacterium]